MQPDEFEYISNGGTLWSWPGQNPLRYRDPSGRTYSLGSVGAGIAGSMAQAATAVRTTLAIQQAIIAGQVSNLIVSGGAVLTGAGALVPRLHSLSQVAINAWQGKVTEVWFRQVIVPVMRSGGFELAGQQVAIETAYGKRIVDFLFIRNGRLFALEIKSVLQAVARSLRSAEQIRLDRYIGRYGGRLTGEGLLPQFRGFAGTNQRVVSSELQVVLQ